MPSNAPQSAPRRLDRAGRALWRSVVERFDLERHESVVLEQACRAVDRAERLRAVVAREGDMIATSDGQPRVHPAAIEARLVELEVARLVASMRFPDDAGARPGRRGARGTYAKGALRSVSGAS